MVKDKVCYVGICVIILIFSLNGGVINYVFK